MQQLDGYQATAAINCNGNGNGNDGGINYKNGYEESIVDIKKEDDSFNNLSQASSCDYSMSQFRADEPPFEVKHEQSYAEDDSTMNNNDQDENDPEEMDDDEEDLPLAMRKRKQEAPDQADRGMDDDDDDIPLLARKKVKKEPKEKSKKKRVKEEAEDDYGSVKPKKKKIKKVGIGYVGFEEHR